jgi:signal recognition particle subunit SEC65
MSKELEKQGWIKRTTIDEPRLSEIVEEYESLGYEVHLEDVKLEDLDQKCRKCYVNQIKKLKTVYIRKIK